MPEAANPWPENRLRDTLAEQLGLIETGLELIEVEHHLSNPNGAAGRVDILARDRSGDLVVIELKRSDQTSRQALHELVKYVSLLADEHGIPVHNLRCILLSTTWHELRVPFARFKATIDFAVDGLQLLLDGEGGPAGVAAVDLPPIPAGIEACPLHALLLYSSDEARSSGLVDLQVAAADVGIGDYFVLLCDRDADALPSHTPFGGYLVLGNLDVEQGLVVEQTCASELEMLDDDFEWNIEEAALAGLFDRVSPEALELSHPDRFLSMREDWSIVDHVASGRYSNKDVWPRDRLEAATTAMGGRHGSSFSRVLRPGHKPNWVRACADLLQCLSVAPKWHDVTAALLHEIEPHADSEVRVGAFCPANTLGALDYLFRGQDSNVLPELRLQYDWGDVERIVHGTLIWDGRVSDSLEEVITSVYDSVEDFFLWSSIVPDADHRLCSALGLNFELVEFAPGDATPQRLRVGTAGALVRGDFDMEDPHNQSVSEFMYAHEPLLLELAEAFDRYTWRPGIPRLADLADLAEETDAHHYGEGEDGDTDPF